MLIAGVRWPGNCRLKQKASQLPPQTRRKVLVSLSVGVVLRGERMRRPSADQVNENEAARLFAVDRNCGWRSSSARPIQRTAEDASAGIRSFWHPR